MRYYFREHLTNEEAKRLNQFVSRNLHGNIFQQTRWVRVRGETRFTPFVYFWGEEEGVLNVSALIRRHRLPGLNWVKDIVDRGPVCSDPDVLREAISELVRLLEGRGSVSLKLNPYWQHPSATQVELDLVQMGFRSLPAERGHHSSTLIIDLSPNEREILRGFRNFTRQRINRALKMGVHVTAVKNEREVNAFCQLYKKMAVIRSIEPLSEDFLARLWRELLHGKEHGLFLIARYQGEIISGLVVLKHGMRAVYTYGTSELQNFIEVPKSQLTHWRAIQWAKGRGCSVYDLGGYLPNVSKESQAYRINQFKIGFSKKRINFVQEHERIFLPVRYLILSWLETARKRIRRICKGFC